MVRLVDGFVEDHARGAASGGPSEGDAEIAHDERLIETPEIGIARLYGDGTERVACLLEDGVNFSEFGHDGGGAERAARGPFNVTLINKLRRRAPLLLVTNSLLILAMLAVGRMIILTCTEYAH